MIKNLGLLAALIGVAGLALAACGGESSDAPTKEEYISQADMICLDGDEAAAKKVDSTFGDEEPTRANLTSAVEDILIPNIEQQLEDLRALTPPEGDEETVNAIYDELETGLEELRSDPVAGAQGTPFAEASKLAGEYGLTDCGNN